MRKRLLSTLLALCMVLSLLPGTTLALDDSSEEPDPELLPLAIAETETAPESTVPEFVSGVIPREFELNYPSYDFQMAIDLETSYRSPYVTPVKNQGSNGLCWAFAAYAALESNAKKNGLGDLDFSEMHMAYSTSNSSGNSMQGFDRVPSGGGNDYYSASYLMRGTSLSGTVDEAADPYSTKLIGERDLSISESKEQTYTVQNILFLTGGTKATSAEVNAIKSAIKEYGGVGASMFIDQTTADEIEGTKTYYNASTYSYFYDGDPVAANHEVEIVGWDDSYPVTNFNADHRPSKPGAWLVKNSYGTTSSWGKDGYFWISYEDYKFPLEAVCFDGIKPYDSGTIVYETDYRVYGSTGSSNVTTSSFARVYTTQTDGESLQSVRVFLNAADAKIEVDYISDFDATAFETDYTFSAKGEKEITYPGWYTIDLKQPATLGAKDSKFAVVVKFTRATAGKIMIGYDPAGIDNTQGLRHEVAQQIA